MFFKLDHFNVDKKINSIFSLTSTAKLKSLKDIRVYGHVRFPDYVKRFDADANAKGFEIQFSNRAEEIAYKDGKIPEDQMWKYSINRYNFRDTWDFSHTNKIKIGCFGDSFTFGDGVESSGTYSKYLENLYQVRSYNVGKGGSSAERVARTFAAFVKFVDIDIAVITLPHIYRELFIDDYGTLVDLIPVADTNNHHHKYMEQYLGLHEHHQLTKLSLITNYIMDIADLKNIKVLFSTWDVPTYNLLKSIVPDNLMADIFPSDIDSKKARDLGHPGKLAHKKHAENIMREINDRAWI